MNGGLWRRGSAVPLLLSLVIMLGLHSLLAVAGRQTLVALLWLAVMGGGVWAAQGLRATLVALAFVVIAAGPRTWFLLHPGPATLLATKAASAIFVGYAIQHVFRTSVIPARRLVGDRVAGALTTYLLLGLLGAMLASMVELRAPGSFAFSPALRDQAAASPPLVEFHFIYYSFITLATVGYGDITPVTPVAQTLAWMEAVSGQMFIAIVIAWLVSASPASRPESSQEEREP